MTTINVPENYGYTLLSVFLYSCFLVPTVMSGKVMAAREKYKVDYPNLYAIPGLHKEAEAFNRVQRGHQSMFESFSVQIAAALIGGLKYPIANAAFSIIYSTGCYLYLLGYEDMNKDVKVARHLKGGPVKYIGFFGSIGSCLILAAELCGWA